MKKSIIFVMMGAALMFTSCKSSQSAYKQAYEKAKAQETVAEQADAPVAAVAVEETPAAPKAAVTDAPVRSEAVVSVAGDLNTYSVICGSFGVKENAQGLCNQLLDKGYKAGIVKNTDKNMYRVYIGTYGTKAEALSHMADFKAAYPTREDFQGSWILLKK